MDIITIIMGFVMLGSFLEPVAIAIGIILSLYMAKKFGGVYRKFFILFAVGWLFQLLHAIDETLLVKAFGSQPQQPGPPPTFPQLLKIAPTYSPIFQGLGINIEFFSVKMTFMIISAVAIVLGIFIYNRLIERR